MVTVLPVLKDMARLIQGESFNKWRRAFVDENIAKFEYGDENRLEYTAIHERYCEAVESQMSAALPAGVSMDAFSAALQEELKAPTGMDEAGEAIKLLLEAGDFTAFKEMMLYEKNKREEAAVLGSARDSALTQATGSSVPKLDFLIDLCARLSNAADADDGWVNLLTNEWMKLDKKPVELERRESSSEIYLRGVWTLSLTFVEACDMMFCFDERRALWDQNSKGFIAHKGDPNKDDDVVVSAILEMGMLLHMAGVPRKLTSRSLLRWDFPTPGTVSYAMAPWDAAKDAYDPKSILQVKVGSIAPHPTDAGKTVFTTLETNRMGGIPKWLLGGLMTYTAPQLMRGLEQRYIKNCRLAGKTRDLTRCAPKK